MKPIRIGVPGSILHHPVGDPPGLVRPGNIDLLHRHVVRNADGTISTVRSITIGTDRGFYLIPTVVKGRVVSDRHAIRHFDRTGQHLGLFSNEPDANSYAEKLHEQQAALYGDKPKPSRITMAGLHGVE